MEKQPVKIEFLNDLMPVYDERSLYRYLGYPRGKRPEERVRQMLEREKKLLPELLNLQGVYAFFSGRECFDREFPLYDREVFLCVVTIGERLEARAAKYAAEGDVLAGFVLDTLGSVCAEGIAEAAYQIFIELARADGVEIGCRISPGYGKWPLTYQKKIFSLLPVDKIGVGLTPGLMMVPRKSVSFAAERSNDPIQMRKGTQCEYCQMENCRYRLKKTEPEKM